MPREQLQSRVGSLEILARERFGALSAAEATMMANASEGSVARCGSTEGDEDPANDPSHENWPPDRHIRAETIHWICVNPRAREHVATQGVQIYGAKFIGEVNLAHAIVPFPLSFRHCDFDNAVCMEAIQIPEVDFSGSYVPSLDCQRAKVAGSVFLQDGFQTHGEVLLKDAQIGGNLSCDGGSFNNPPKDGCKEDSLALDADSVTVTGHVFLREVDRTESIQKKTIPFHAMGQVRFVNAQVGGGLECSGGIFENPEGKGCQRVALYADLATVKGKIALNNNFLAKGIVKLAGAHMGVLDCRKGNFKEAKLDLRAASANWLMDDYDSWPKKGNLGLDGFAYTRILAGPTDADTRLTWLALSPFATQPYLQLAKVLKDAGDEGGAIKVLVKMERQRNNKNFIDPVWRPVFRFTVGYGYRPLLAFWEVVGMTALGWILYRRSYLAGNMVPTEKESYKSFKENGQPPDHYARFSPIIYSVENSLPLVKLGQEEKWQPNPHPEDRKAFPAGFGAPYAWHRFRWLQRLLIFFGLQADPDPTRMPSRPSRWATSARFLRWFLWIQILLGWLLATLFVAGVTGIVQK